MIKTAKIRAIHKAIEEAESVIITAGAGMGIDSGLPDFRGKEGLWKAYPALAEMHLNFAEMANPSWFFEKPEVAWAFYGHRLHQYNTTKPHVGFDMLLDYVKSKNDNYFIVTSNVDGAFQKAGFDPMKIREKHGAIYKLQCINGCRSDIWPADYGSVVVDEEAFKARKMPTCPYCGKVARPNILMFGDYGWLCDREEMQRHHFNSWMEGVSKKEQKLLIIEAGAGIDLPSIRRLSESLKSQYRKADLIRINPRHSEVPDGAFGLAMGGLEGIKTMLGGR